MDVIEIEPSVTIRQESKRTVIRDVAAAIFAARGYHGASVQEVANALEITKASLYYYYRSKEEMLFDILTHAHDEVLAIFTAIDASGDGLLDKIRQLVAAHVTWYLRHPDIAKVAFRDWAELTGDALEVQIERRRVYSHSLRGYLERCEAEGLLPADANITLIANFINGAVAATNVWFNPAGPDTPEDVGRAYGEMAISVITARASPDQVAVCASARSSASSGTGPKSG